MERGFLSPSPFLVAGEAIAAFDATWVEMAQQQDRRSDAATERPRSATAPEISFPFTTAAGSTSERCMSRRSQRKTAASPLWLRFSRRRQADITVAAHAPQLPPGIAYGDPWHATTSTPNMPGGSPDCLLPGSDLVKGGQVVATWIRRILRFAGQAQQAGAARSGSKSQ
jgi:hypothetical protein